MSRALGVRRLSHLTDESTSIERQGDQIENNVKARGDALVYMTCDTDVSGSVSPFEREDLGPWLTDPDKIAQWDYLIFTKLDRLTRSLIDFDTIVNWCDKNGKTVVSISESIDLSSYVGRMLANILAMFAQFESERMAERRKEAYDKLKAQGYYQGGPVPYGYKAVKKGDHWELEIDSPKAETVRWIASQFVTGKSRNAIARDLAAKGVPSPKGAQWSMLAVKRVLESCEGFLGAEDYGKVKDRLEGTTKGYTRRTDTTMLLNIAFCTCGAPLYSRRDGKYQYYKCYGKCGAGVISMGQLDGTIDEAIVDSYGWVPLMAKTVKTGKSHASEISAVERQIRELDLDAPNYDDQHSKLRAERMRLRNLPSAPDVVDNAPTGETTADYWPKLDAHAKREFLLANGIKVHAKREADGHVSVVIGPDMETLEGGEYFITVSQLSLLAT
jgi:DNA invertase Pin-like site-specific DNA recombinase